MSKPNWARGLWQRIQEPRVVTAVQTIVYALCAVGGISTILDPTSSIEGAFGGGVILTWGIFALICEVMGAFDAPGGKWLIEKPAIIACITAIGIYAGIILTTQLTSRGNRIVRMVRRPFFV